MGDRRRGASWDERDHNAEIVWKWISRVVGLSLFAILLLSHAQVPIPGYVVLGGLMGLPSVVSAQREWNRRRLPPPADRVPSDGEAGE